MPSIILPGRWLEQPSYPVELDWEHELARGLMLSAPLSHDRQFYSLRGPRLLAVSGAKARRFHGREAAGFYSTYGTGTSDNVYLPDTEHVTGPVTWVAWYQRNGAGGNGLGRILDKGTAAGGVSGYRLYNTTSTIALNVDYSTTSAESRINVTFNTNWNQVAVTQDLSVPGTAAVMYHNGASQSVTFAITGVGTQLTNTDELYLGNRKLSNNRGWDGHLRDFLQYTRILSNAEIEELYRNPYQIYRRRTARIYSFPSGASGNTISVPAGNLSLTGFAPTVLNGANQVVNVPTGSLTLTGHTPTVVSTANQTIAVPAGSLIITGYAPTVRVGNDQIVVVPAGSLTLTGYAPTIVTTNNKFISVPVGTLVLTGYAPTVLGGEISNRGSRSWTESERRLNERLRRLALQQARWEDDEEALAILLASIIRR